MTGTAQTTEVRQMLHLILERTLTRRVIVVALMVAGCSHGLALQPKTAPRKARASAVR
jgi:hypothetical protein